MTERNIGKVIDQIIEIAPDLEIHFTSLIRDMRYRAPEMMFQNWADLTRIMNLHAANHPKINELIALVNRIALPPQENLK